MRQAHRIIITLVALGASGSTLGAEDRAGALSQGRALLKEGKCEKAAAILEEALPTCPATDRATVLDLLRSAYRTMIGKAEAAGNARLAQEYRDNLVILDIPWSGPREIPLQPSPPAARDNPADHDALPPLEIAPKTVASPPPSTAPRTDPAVRRAEMNPLPRAASTREPGPFGEPPALPDPGPLPPPSDPIPPKPSANPNPAAPAAEPMPRAEAGPTVPIRARPSERLPAMPTDGPGIGQPTGDQGSRTRDQGPAMPTADQELSQADQLFTAKRYAEAGLIYSRLAATNRLPDQRKQVWAYCRWVAVVGRINAHPRTNEEWDDIEQEVRGIQRLVPGNWYGEYLRNRVIEARKSTGRAGRLVVRGSAPEEEKPRRLPGLLGRARAAAPRPPAAPAGAGQTLSLPAQPDSQEAAPAKGVDGPAAAADPPGADPVSWHVYESANFRVFHVDSAAALQASQAAEAVRSTQAKRWGSTATRSTWSPKCDIYLYPTPKDFARMTGQPETSPGFSTMGVNGNRIIARRVNLRADHPQLLTAILPHEVTHVVLADLFTEKQIPRWADEGMAVLAEPVSEQLSRAGDLAAPLDQGRLFKLSELMAIDYPNAESWALYYAQSVSLTQFLVASGTPEQFVGFVRTAQREGIEQALRDFYQIEGFPDLEKRWRSYARRQLATITAAKESASGTTDTVRRE